MNPESATIAMMWAEIAVACGLFAAGILVGLFASRFGRGVRGRVHRLETELSREREASRRYSQTVAEHFERTSDLFRELTHKYTALYSHLAEGARSLCADRAPTIGSAFEHAGLLAAGGAGSESEADTRASAKAPVDSERAPAPADTGGDGERPPQDEDQARVSA
jgi:uncharacterized membrane-anchored protein YhcB (DUF1043 family)